MTARLLYLFPILVSLLTLSAGCSSTFYVADNQPTAFQNATTFKPPPGMSGIYVIREGGMVGAAVSWQVDLDYQPFVLTPPRACTYTAIPPGKHNLRVIYQDDGLDFNTLPDTNYFFLVKASFSGDVVPLSDKEGREDAADFAKHYK